MQRQLDPEYEAALIRRAQRDPSHFKQLYRAYINRVYAYIAYRLNHPQEAEDLTANIFMQALRQISQYKSHRGSFSAWLFGIAHHALVDYWRRNASRYSVEYDNNAPLAENSPEKYVIQSEQSERMLQIIGMLPERRQEVVILKFFSGLRNKEIATVLALDERTVASHLSRALDDLRKLIVIEEEWHDPA